MKATYFHAAGAIALTFGIAACVPRAEPPPPAPPPVAAPAPTPTPPPPPVVQQPQYENYLDAPQTPGDWDYQRNASGPVAVFIGANGDGEFVMACNRARGAIDLLRAGSSPVPRTMRIQTETATRAFQAIPIEDTNRYLATTLAASDPLLDAMAITKGRFAVEVEGERALYLPAWVEVSRVIEDCR